MADNQLIHFNISVGITSEFMEQLKVEELGYNTTWKVKSPTSGKVIDSKLSPSYFLRKIAENAWKNGDPGVYFIDTANRDNMVKYLGSLDATNPCGEVPLLPYEPCCLGSINLKAFVDGNYIDFPYLARVIKLAVRFLDNVQTLSYTPIEEVNFASKQTRRLGLGVMGFADLLAEMDIRYDSEDAITLSKTLAQYIGLTAWKASKELGKEKGVFPAYDSNRVDIGWLDERYNGAIKFTNLRNVAVTSIAPTGTIALLADCNSGIEPFFSKKYIRNITEGKENKAVDSINQEIKWDNIKTANEIHWKDHINIQSAWQMYTDNAVSKTINMPENATIDDIYQAYIYAYKMGCKGITVYRNNSKLFQILN